MRTHVEFRSALFPPYPGEEEEINPDLWGKRLAEFLMAKLPAEGVAVPKDAMFVEDWGVGFWVVNSAFPMWIGCGHYQEYEDGYLVFVEPSKPTIRKGLFGRIDTTADVERVASSLDRVLRAEPGIRDLRWWDDGDT